MRPEAVGTNAFAFSWSNLRVYAFPPPVLIGRTIQKAIREDASLILVTPAWPSAPFWPNLAGKAEGPVLIQRNKVDIIPGRRHTVDLTTHFAAWYLSSRYGMI